MNLLRMLMIVVVTGSVAACRDPTLACRDGVDECPDGLVCSGGHCREPADNSTSSGGAGSTSSSTGGSSGIGGSSSIGGSSNSGGSSSVGGSSSSVGGSSSSVGGDISSTGGSSSTGVSSSGIHRPSVHVQLTWDVAVGDLDAHLVRGDAQLCSSLDCFPQTCVGPQRVDWDGNGPTPGDPVADVDDTQGFGPENINVAAALEGEYDVGVFAYTTAGADAGANATLTSFWMARYPVSSSTASTGTG